MSPSEQAANSIAARNQGPTQSRIMVVRSIAPTNIANGIWRNIMVTTEFLIICGAEQRVIENSPANNIY